MIPLQDGQAMLWDLNEGKHLYTLDSGDTINALCFSPNRYWLCAATGPSIKIWVNSLNFRISWSNNAALKVAVMKLWMLTVLSDDNRGCFWAPGLINPEIIENLSLTFTSVQLLTTAFNV